VSVYRHPVHGAWIISAIVGGYFVEQAYYGYTKREAMKLFRERIKSLA
jgi:hypothetical protein